MKDKAPEGWLHRCSCRREKQVQSLQEFVTPLEKVVCHAHHTFRAQGNLLRHTLTQTEIEQRRTRGVQEKHLTYERIRDEQQEVGDFLKFREEEAVQGEHEAAKPRLSWKRNFTRDYYLKSKGLRDSEGKSEILGHESRAERSADAIRELGRQLRSQHIEIYHGDQEYEAARR